MLGGMGWVGCNNVLCLRYHRFSPVNTFHVTLHTSVVLRWTHFMLRRTHNFNSVNTLHVTLYTYVLIRWTYFGEHTCYTSWQWRYIHRNADVCDITAKTVRKLKWWKRIAGAVAKRKTISKNFSVTFFEGVQHAFLNSHCNKTRNFHKSQWKWSAKRHHHDINMWQMRSFQQDENHNEN